MAQGQPAPAPTSRDSKVNVDEKDYVALLVRASLMLVSEGFPSEVQYHGTKMIQHVLKFRRAKHSSVDLLNETSMLPLSANINLSALTEETDGGSKPIVYNGLGTESDIINATSRLIYSLESDGSTHSSSTHESGTRSEASTVFSSESSNRNDLSCIRSPGLSFDAKVDSNERELIVQRIMSMGISDYNMDGGGLEDLVGPMDQDELGSRITVSKGIADIIHPRMLDFDGKIYSHEVKGCLLLAEHNILCQALTCCFREPQCTSVLHCLLNALNTIWTRSEWKNTFFDSGLGLSCLFSNNQFLEMVYNVVEFFEDNLKSIDKGFPEMKSQDTYFISLLRLFLPVLSQLLQCIHALWNDQISCYLFEELERAKTLMSCEEGLGQNDTRELLEKTRLCGYNIIGLSMSLEGAFTKILDSLSLSAAFKDLGYMEFRHLGALIHLVFLQLVKKCPSEFWNEWIHLLRPLLSHCENVLNYAWFDLIYKGQIGPAYYFGELSGSAENVEKLRCTILFEFTREVSRLFGNLCSSESNRSSHSLIEYLLGNDCFGSLRMSLFGYWVDGAAAIEAIPFCRSLVSLAGATNDESLRLFVLDELLPSIIKRLDDQLPCAVRDLISMLNLSTSDDVEKDLHGLCQESFNYLYSNNAQRQDVVVNSMDRDNAGANFICWFTKQRNDFHAKASQTAPDEFNVWKVVWKWEFEDEFRRYLPIYIDMLKEVDAVNESLKHPLSDWDYLQKLQPRFRSKYGINSVEHPHFRSISYMRRRKFKSVVQVKHTEEMYEFLCTHITLKPYIKGSDSFYNVIDRLDHAVKIKSSTFDSDDEEDSVRVLLDSILSLWEPHFHPRIREGHKDLLLQIIGQLTKGKEFKTFQPLAPDLEDLPRHLKHYALLYIMSKLETPMFASAKEQFSKHKDFDNYLASGELDRYIQDSLFVQDDFSNWYFSCALPDRFLVLNHELVRLSLKRRAEVLEICHQVDIYSACLKHTLVDESLGDRLNELIRMIGVEGFFDVDSDNVTLEDKRFTELVAKFNDEVFAGCSLPKHFVIRGIIDYQAISLRKECRISVFEQVVGEPCRKLIKYLLRKFWKDTRHYMHEFYDILRDPIGKIFAEDGSGLSLYAS